MRFSSDGVITFSYNQVAARDGLVGLSNAQPPFLVNYSLDLPQAIGGFPVAELFNGEIERQGLPKRFYSTFQLGPSGVQSQQPVTITYPVGDIDGDGILDGTDFPIDSVQFERVEDSLAYVPLPDRLASRK